MQPTFLASPLRLPRRFRNKAIALQKLHDRERRRLRAEIEEIPGLMTLLMKPRNGGAWSPADRAAIRTQFRSLSRRSLYVAAVVAPGTLVTLPLLAWWLDRRHARRPLAAGAQSSV